MAIKSGTLKRKYFEKALDNNILCRNALLMVLATMRQNEKFVTEDKRKVAQVLMDNGYTGDYVLKIVPQITNEYLPTEAQVKQLLNVIENGYTYDDTYIPDSLLKSVNRKDLNPEYEPKSGKVDTMALKKMIRAQGKVEDILTAIGCENIKYQKKITGASYWRCTNLGGDNSGAVNVKDEDYLGVWNWTKPEFDQFDEGHDIISLVRFNINRCGFKEAVDFIKKVLEADEEDIRLFKLQAEEYEEKEEAEIEVEKEEIKTWDVSLLENRFLDKRIHQSWLNEGITQEVAERFYIRYVDEAKINPEKNITHPRQYILIPHRYYENGGVMGYNRRYVMPDLDMLIQIGKVSSKYKVDAGMKKGSNIYGLYENKEYIKELGYITITESEKSTLKRASFGDNSTVSLGGKNITQRQLEIMKDLDLKEYVLCFDQDVSEEELIYMCQKIQRSVGENKIVSYIFDSFGLLEPKQSPADLNDEKYKFLFEKRTKV